MALADVRKARALDFGEQAGFDQTFERCAFNFSDGSIALVRLADGHELMRLPSHGLPVVFPPQFSPDGKMLLTGSADRSARLWDVATCLPLGPPMLCRSEVMSVAFDPTGRSALAGRLWRLPAPLPDDQELIDLWVQLATQRTFTAGDNIEWLDSAALEDLAAEFRALTGKSWSEWADSSQSK